MPITAARVVNTAALSHPADIVPVMTDTLTDHEAALLTFERQTWRYAGAKATAVREGFGWSLTRHEQAVLALLDRPAALIADPQTVRRLQRVQDQRRARRIAV